MTDTEKIVEASMEFSWRTANTPGVGNAIRAKFEEITHWIRQSDAHEVPNDAANGSLEGSAEFDGSGWADAAWHLECEDVAPERHGASDGPGAA